MTRSPLSPARRHPHPYRIDLSPAGMTANRHMEYVKQRGSFNDLPLANIVATFREIYSNWMPDGASTSQLHSADFAADVANETRPV